MPFLSDAGVGARVAEAIAPAERDSDEDRSMDPDDDRDYEDQFPCPPAPQADSTGGINYENLEILDAILKQIPECINEADFQQLSDLLPHMEPVQVATRTVKEAIAVIY